MATKLASRGQLGWSAAIAVLVAGCSDDSSSGVYFTTDGLASGRLMRAGLDGSNPMVVLEHDAALGNVRVTDTTAFVSERNGDQLLSVSKCGCP